MIISRALLLRTKNILDKFVEKIKTHFMFNNIFSRKSCLLWDSAEKYDTAGETKDETTAHAHCMPDDQGYKHTLRIRNTYWFFTVTRLHGRASTLRLYVHCIVLTPISPKSLFLKMAAVKRSFHSKLPVSLPLFLSLQWLVMQGDKKAFVHLMITIQYTTWLNLTAW
jgi:hypothetical protein